MSALSNLQSIQQKNRSMICLGLDLDPKKMPSEYAGSIKGMFDFAHRIIDATADLVCAYKPNLAFYEALGPEGLSLLRLIRDRIPEGVPVIMDGKRGDIGNTAQYYAESLFDRLRADWVTLSPYMGFDSLRPFLEYKDKGAFILCLTSNAGAKDFQLLDVGGRPLYTVVAEKVAGWNKDQNCGLVVGATHPSQLRDIRGLAGDMPLLIPGVGAQGGSLEEAATLGTDDFRAPAVINVSRSVLYASSDKEFAQKARYELEKLNATVSSLRIGRQQSQLATQVPIEQAVTEQDQTAPTDQPPSQQNG